MIVRNKFCPTDAGRKTVALGYDDLSRIFDIPEGLHTKTTGDRWNIVWVGDYDSNKTVFVGVTPGKAKVFIASYQDFWCIEARTKQVDRSLLAQVLLKIRLGVWENDKPLPEGALTVGKPLRGGD